MSQPNPKKDELALEVLRLGSRDLTTVAILPDRIFLHQEAEMVGLSGVYLDSRDARKVARSLLKAAKKLKKKKP